MSVAFVLCTLHIHSKTILKRFQRYQKNLESFNQVLYLSNLISVSLSNARISSQGTPTKRCILC